MLRTYLGLSKSEWRTFKVRNLELLASFAQNHAGLKEKYLSKWWYAKWLLRRFKHKRIVRFEKIKLFFTRKVSVPTMDFNITSRCTLKCQDCGSLMPLYTKEQHFDETLEGFKVRLDALLENVNHIFQFKIIGGEPLLNKDFARILDYACSKSQILSVEITTNGTICPTDEVLESLKRNKARISIFISNYTLHNKTKYEQVLEILSQNSIPHRTIRDASDFRWIQRGDIFARNRDKAGLKETFWNCWQKNCVSYFEGYFLVCTRAYYVQRALNANVNIGEGINLNVPTSSTANATATNGGGGNQPHKPLANLAKICRVNLSNFMQENILARVIIAIILARDTDILTLGYKLNDFWRESRKVLSSLREFAKRSGANSWQSSLFVIARFHANAWNRGNP